jgi:DNA-directed RNA polymerase specialized sigma24 family protein
MIQTPFIQRQVDIKDLDVPGRSGGVELERLDPSQARVVELRYFGGLTEEETAAVMNTSISTVKREWILAKTWIRKSLLEEGSTP